MIRQSIIAKPHSICLRPAPDTGVWIDREGRVINAHLEGAYYRVGLNGQVIKRRDRTVCELDAPNTEDFHELTRQIGMRFYRAYLEGDASVDWRVSSMAEEPESMDRTLGRMIRRGRAAREAERRDFLRLYPSVPLLPPDQFLSVAVQPSTGFDPTPCVRCLRLTPTLTMPKSEGEFAAHVAGIKRFLGRSIDLRQCVYIDERDLPGQGADSAGRLLDLINAELGPRPIHGWADLYGNTKTDEAFARAMSRQGLKRLYLWVQSGSRAFQNLYSVALDIEGLASRVRAFKSGGVSVALLFVAGVGGARFEEAHVTETTNLLQRVKLDQDDRVYFYVFHLHPAAYLAEMCRAEGLVALDKEETRAQFDMLKELCAKHYGGAVPKVCLFDSVESTY